MAAPYNNPPLSVLEPAGILSGLFEATGLAINMGYLRMYLLASRSAHKDPIGKSRSLSKYCTHGSICKTASLYPSSAILK